MDLTIVSRGKSSLVAQHQNHATVFIKTFQSTPNSKLKLQYAKTKQDPDKETMTI